MPPRWSRVPTRKDPDFRRLDDRMTFATHVAALVAFNGGVWFFKLLRHSDATWQLWFSGIWATVFFAHGIYVFVIAKYEDQIDSNAEG
jgi:2TM domain